MHASKLRGDRLRLWQRVVLFVVFLLLSSGSFSQSLSEQRDLYAKARQAQSSGYWTTATRLMRQLKAYPLYSYLRYYQLRAHLDAAHYQQIVAFRQQYRNTPLADALERAFLYKLAKQRQWSLFLKFYPNEPGSPSLRCSYYYAHYHQKNYQVAWQGAKRLWLSGRSRPKSCDRLFAAFKRSGQLTQKLIWKRLLLSYGSYQSGLQDYLERQLHGRYLMSAKQLKRDDATPEKLLRHSVILTSLHRQTLRLVLMRLTWQEPSLAIKIFKQYQKQLTFRGLVDSQLLIQLIRSVIRYPTPDLLKWADKALLEHPEAVTLERRLRLALTQQNWSDVQRFLGQLSTAQKESTRWRYWQARLDEQLGQDQKAIKIWRELADQRNYYGFLSAQRLGTDYRFYSAMLPSIIPASQLQNMGWRQVRELFAQNNYRQAYVRWQYLLRPFSDHDKLRWGMMALYDDRPALSVYSTIRAKAWNLLPMRFPIAYSQYFVKQARNYQVDPLLLLSVARQESGFYRYAQSHAGARGIMQVTPSTARHLLSQQGKRLRTTSQLYDLEFNISLGTRYLSMLLDRFHGNRFVAIAAYNAGPSRVDRWFERLGALPADIWIESIPFNETRRYVKNILAFELIYAHRLGQTRELLRPEELMVNLKSIGESKDSAG
ncbi:MAG: Soluble lytic murein transglycosylase [Candidatus Celerinatantimonas neptuna]|nr:MAG: Soluble lytic murein transglycosylase [Candidatus Celerinatantimonas neptuna]